jgi:hypothetical protein
MRESRPAVASGLLAAVAACLAVGCGEKAPDAPAAPADAPSKRASGPDPTAGMVAAVTPGQSGRVADLKFRIGSRPVPGQPVEIELALIPRATTTSVRLIVQGADGLQIRSGQELPTVRGAAPGVPLMHRLTLVPTRDGIFSVAAVALVDTESSSITRTFAIPLIVGEGVLPSAQ